MPTVPRTQRQVSLERLPGVRLTAAETEQSTGANAELATARSREALGQLGGTLAGIGISKFAQLQQQERDRADSIAILNAENRIAAWESNRLYNPESGALAVKGKDSFGLPEKVGEEYTKLVSDIEKELGSDRQRDMFQRVKANRGTNLDLTLRRHVFGEMQQYEKSELDAMVRNSISSAVLNANDPARIGEELDRAIGAIKTHAPRLGMGPEQIDRQVREVTSTTHAGVIEQLLALDKDKAAKAYFEETRGQLNGDQVAKIERALEEGTLRGESQRQADAIVAAGGTLTEQRAKAREIDDSKLRDQVLQRIEHEAIIKEKEDRDREEATLIDAYNRVDRAGGNVRSIPPAVWAGLSGNARSALRAYGEHIARGVPVQTDYTSYYALMKKAADNPDAFVQENLLTYKHKLDEGDFKQLAGLQLSMKNADKKAVERDLGGFRTNDQILKDTLALYNIDTDAKPNTDEGRKIAQIRRLLDESLEAQANLTGKKPSNADIQEHLDRLLIPSLTKKGSWWNILPGGEPFNDVQQRLIDLQITDVPALDKQQISEALKRRGRAVTDQTILDMFIARQMRERK